MTDLKKRNLVVGDLHGAYDGFMEVLELAKFNPEKDRLITLGDLCDRGPKTYEIVEYLAKLPNHVSILGNHDDWFIQWLNTGIHPDNWQQGGYDTLLSYGTNALGEEWNKFYSKFENFTVTTNLNPGHIPSHHLNYWNRMSLYFIDEDNNLYVHGGFNRHLPISGQPKQVLLWDRDLFMSSLSYKDIDTNKYKYKFKIKDNFNNIFIGHTSTINWKTDKPMFTGNNIINLDTGGGGGGRITVMDSKTKDYWQSSIID